MHWRVRISGCSVSKGSEPRSNGTSAKYKSVNTAGLFAGVQSHAHHYDQKDNGQDNFDKHDDITLYRYYVVSIFRCLVEANLQLAHEGVTVVADKDALCHIGTLIDILQLHTALPVEPVLYARNGLVLVHAQFGVEVEEVV